MTRLQLILHNIRSVYNVGSIFRTADAAGVEKIYLTGYTPRPVDKFGRVNQKMAKTALGAERSVDWQGQVKLSGLIRRLQDEGREVVAVEQSREAVDYKKYQLSRPAVFIFGNEVAGLSPAVLKKADRIIEIPTRGEKESLNVSVAAGIVLFR